VHFLIQKRNKMAKRDRFSSQVQKREIRYFSEDFRKKKVEELERRITSVSEICKVYQVSSTAVYKWMNKYSLMRNKGIKTVVESASDTARIKAMQEQIAKLEQLVGQKQFQIEFLQKQMEIASENYGVDFKKKVSGKPSSGIGGTQTNTGTK
jgi:transposase